MRSYGQMITRLCRERDLATDPKEKKRLTEEIRELREAAARPAGKGERT